MRYFAHIEVELEADDLEDATANAEDLAIEISDHFVFETKAVFLVNVEEDTCQ